MDVFEYEHRWVYKGAINEPPCEQFAYWNVLQTVYPIELKQFDFLKDFMYSKKDYLGTYKNNRKIN